MSDPQRHRPPEQSLRWAAAAIGPGAWPAFGLAMLERHFERSLDQSD